MARVVRCLCVSSSTHLCLARPRELLLYPLPPPSTLIFAIQIIAHPRRYFAIIPLTTLFRSVGLTGYSPQSHPPCSNPQNPTHQRPFWEPELANCRLVSALYLVQDLFLTCSSHSSSAPPPYTAPPLPPGAPPVLPARPSPTFCRPRLHERIGPAILDGPYT